MLKDVKELRLCRLSLHPGSATANTIRPLLFKIVPEARSETGYAPLRIPCRRGPGDLHIT